MAMRRQAGTGTDPDALEGAAPLIRGYRRLQPGGPGRGARQERGRGVQSGMPAHPDSMCPTPSQRRRRSRPAWAGPVLDAGTALEGPVRA